MVRRSCLISLVLSMAIAGCGEGGDDGGGTGTGGTTAGGPEEEVRATVTAFIDADDPEAICGEMISAGYLEQWYGGRRAACIKQVRDGLKEEQGEKEILGVEVPSETEARVEIEHTSGRIAGVRGHTAWVREGDAWKLDDYEDDYLRSDVEVSAEATDEEGGTSALAYDPLRECVMQRVDRWSSAKLRRFVIAAQSEQPEAKDYFNDEMAKCPSALSAYVADTLSDALFEKGDYPRPFVRCMRTTMRNLLLVTGLAEKALRGNTSDAGNAAIGGLAKGAQKQCADKL